MVGQPHAPLCTISAPGMLRMCSVVGCLISGRRSGLTASAAHGPGGWAVRVWGATALRKTTTMKREQTYAIQNFMQRLASRPSQGPGGPRPCEARAVQARQPPRATAPPTATASDHAARRRAVQAHERPRRPSQGGAGPQATAPPVEERRRPAERRRPEGERWMCPGRIQRFLPLNGSSSSRRKGLEDTAGEHAWKERQRGGAFGLKEGGRKT